MPGSNSTSTSGANTGIVFPEPRIPETAFLVTLLTLYGVAIVAAAVRTGVRWRHYRVIGSSDCFLIFACVVLTGSIGFTLGTRNITYDATAGREPSVMIVAEHQLILVGQLLPWIAIYSVKLGFLMVFKKLVHRVRTMEILWWIATAFVVLSFAAVAALCVYVDLNASHANSEDTAGPINKLQPIYIGVSISLDVISDAVIVSIPIKLLWKLQIRPLAKLVIGLILSLSTVMIIIAIIRAALARAPNTTPAGDGTDHVQIDLVWLIFWQAVEAEVAVIMLGLTATRALFPNLQLRRNARDGTAQEDADAAEAGARAGPEQGAAVRIATSGRNERSIQEMTIKIQITTEPRQEQPMSPGASSPTNHPHTMEDASGPWLRPKTSRGKLSKKASETSMRTVRSSKRPRQQQQPQRPRLPERAQSSQDKSSGSKKQRPKLNKFPSADDVAASSAPSTPRDRRWPRTPRILQANRSPHFGSPRHRSLERSASGRRLIDPEPNNNPPDVIDLTMDFAAAVWAAPPTPDSMSGRKKGRDRKADGGRGKKVEGRGPASPLGDTRNDYFDEDDEELMRQEELRQEEEDRRRWLLLQRKYENEKPLPPPVSRPPGRIIQMDAIHKPRPESRKPPHRASKMPGGLF